MCINKYGMSKNAKKCFFVIIVKILVLMLSALGISTMWMVVFADVGVTVLAVLNSFRVLYSKK